jgi:hypothetical protein
MGVDCVTVICAYDQAEAERVRQDLGLSRHAAVMTATAPEQLMGIHTLELRIVQTRRFHERADADEVRQALLPAELSSRAVRRISWPFGAGGAGRPWKRAQLDTRTVLAAVAEHDGGVYGELATVFPSKVVLAAFRRETDRRRLEFGVAEHLPWLTDKGRSWLSRHQ